ncbi:MAG TPA: tetratricopeptide repeat protein [Bacteroidia bacterium]|nr:tetratricopeptide repeat protein [Bacteroidia bacterium]
MPHLDLNIRLLVMSLFLTRLLPGQEDGKMIYDGNQQYYSGRIPESSATYARALELNPANRKANFNLGTALYKNGMLIKSGKVQVPQGMNMTPDSLSKLVFDQAAQNFAVVANSVSNKDTLHRAWHNIGNCYLQKKAYKEAVDAYKKALKFNPSDEESRYNLAYALKHLPKDKKGGGSSKQPQPQNKQEEDKKDQNKNAAPRENQMKKEQAEQILKALMNSEKKLQDQRKQKQQSEKPPADKDW